MSQWLLKYFTTGKMHGPITTISFYLPPWPLLTKPSQGIWESKKSEEKFTPLGYQPLWILCQTNECSF